MAVKPVGTVKPVVKVKPKVKASEDAAVPVGKRAKTNDQCKRDDVQEPSKSGEEPAGLPGLLGMMMVLVGFAFSWLMLLSLQKNMKRESGMHVCGCNFCTIVVQIIIHALSTQESMDHHQTKTSDQHEDHLSNFALGAAYPHVTVACVFSSLHACVPPLLLIRLFFLEHVHNPTAHVPSTLEKINGQCFVSEQYNRYTISSCLPLSQQCFTSFAPLSVHLSQHNSDNTLLSSTHRCTSVHHKHVVK